MLKLITDEWLSEERESKSTRDAAREQFWAEIGVSRVRDVQTIGIEPTARVPHILSLLSKVSETTSDDGIKEAAEVSSSAISTYRIGELDFSGIVSPISLRNISVSEYSKFFNVDVAPDFDLSRIGNG